VPGTSGAAAFGRAAGVCSEPVVAVGGGLVGGGGGAGGGVPAVTVGVSVAVGGVAAADSGGVAGGGMGAGGVFPAIVVGVGVGGGVFAVCAGGEVVAVVGAGPCFRVLVGLLSAVAAVRVACACRRRFAAESVRRASLSSSSRISSSSAGSCCDFVRVPVDLGVKSS
jgi:hypothetical protein